MFLDGKPITKMALLMAGAAGGPYVLHEASNSGALNGTTATASSELLPGQQQLADAAGKYLKSAEESVSKFGQQVSGTETGQTSSFSSVSTASAGQTGQPILPGSYDSRQLTDSSANIVPSNLANSTLNPNGTAQPPWAFQTDPKALPTIEQLQNSPTGATLTGGTIDDYREVLRFDATPEWVTQKFSRVSTVLGDTQLDGLRVPLVTGTRTFDLVGTLTYYFDKSRRVQRITFHGQTGDPSRLVGLLQQYYHFKPENALGGSVYFVRWNTQIASVLRLETAPVIYATQPGSTYRVILEINQAGMSFALSPEATAFVEEGRRAGRW